MEGLNIIEDEKFFFMFSSPKAFVREYLLDESFETPSAEMWINFYN